MATKVPLLDLQAQYRPLRDEILAAMTRVCDSQRFIMGPEIDALETELSGLLGVRHSIAVSSGTDAVLLALMALDIRAGDEVIAPCFPEIPYDADAPREAEVRRVSAEVLRIFETIIREHPDQWHVLDPIWDAEAVRT